MIFLKDHKTLTSAISLILIVLSSMRDVIAIVYLEFQGNMV